MNHQATFYTYNLYLSVSLMVIVASIYLKFYTKVRGRVGTILPTQTPPKFLPTPTPQPWLSVTALLFLFRVGKKIQSSLTLSSMRANTPGHGGVLTYFPCLPKVCHTFKMSVT
jgi:hypothetical protein